VPESLGKLWSGETSGKIKSSHSGGEQNLNRVEKQLAERQRT
jgi:hypothetical protein